MDRREAVLRELNLYPLWRLRDQPAQVAASPSPAHVDAEAEPAMPVAAEVKAVAATAVNAPTPFSHSPSIAGVRGELSDLGWPELKQQVRNCTDCRLRAGCTQTVFGVGDEKAEWLFVGEGPGADEDALGEPFVGQAGKLLDNMLTAIKLKRGNGVYIANIVKCRPPDNRTPAADEIAQCLPYLQRQIELIQPRMIVALGKVASNALLGRDATLASLRGKLHDYRGIPLVVTYHPAYLLRTPSEKAMAWQDLCFGVDSLAAK
ncbi:MAG: Phage SPO1 DNA polymerase-related protein [Candidatus Gallionella acididurans]|uniref:Type-4 uracil-DNA glycosylase n=1 Tax=Candidatus Gallionella acididurans TaxID=1796491 RepID=A0A139BVY2_9PROT|nr:MAG: Phage SPO1 DNA polymerase-related protein [Candidatus Gallionella acididurans]